MENITEKKIIAGLMAGILFLAVLVSDSCYVVDEKQQVVITQFGQSVGKPAKSAGLYFKIPFLQTVSFLERRILSWNSRLTEVLTRDKYDLQIDLTAQWRIVDPVKFVQSVGSEKIAEVRLTSVIPAVTRDTLGGLDFVEVVRNANRLPLAAGQERNLGEEASGNFSGEKISAGRELVLREIERRSAVLLAQEGIELLDVIIKRMNVSAREKDHETPTNN